MAWDEEINIISRALINDMDSVTYTDDRLNQAILVAMRYVTAYLDFQTTYIIDVVNEVITPDPTLAPNRDENLINLTSLKTACIIDRGSAAAAADQAIRVRDGQSEVDLRSAFKAKLDLIKAGWCAVYEDAKTEYVYARTDEIVGAAVMTPFRLFAGFGNDVPFGTQGIYRWGSR